MTPEIMRYAEYMRAHPEATPMTLSAFLALEARAAMEARAAADVRNGDVLEKAEQLEVSKRLRAFGFTVRSLSQARASKQAPGLGDLWISHRGVRWAGWWETKRQVGGRLSPAQLDFQEDCAACGVHYRVGDRFAADALLVELGLAQRAPDGTLEAARKTA